MAEIAFLVKNPENGSKNCRQIVDKPKPPSPSSKQNVA
jgi:hypothetical protein